MAKAGFRFEPNDKGLRQLAKSVADKTTAATNRALSECTPDMTVDQAVLHVSSALRAIGIEPAAALRDLVAKYMAEQHGVE